MRFDLGQLFQGPTRELVLDQFTKNLGLTRYDANTVFDKSLSISLARMARKSLRRDSAHTMFDAMKDISFDINPSHLLSEQNTPSSDQVSHLIEQGKQLIPDFFSSKTERVKNYLTDKTSLPTHSVQSALGLILPIIFIFFKDKINEGVNLARLTGYIGDQANNISSFIDQDALNALGINGTFDELFLALEKAPALFIAGTSSAGDFHISSNAEEAPKAQAANVTQATDTSKSCHQSCMLKWLIPVVILTAIILILKIYS